MKYYLGIDLGGTNIATGITNENGTLLFKASERTNTSQSFKALVADIAAAAKRTVWSYGLKQEDISAVGMGTPSCIDPQTNLLVNANNLNWKNVPLYDELKKHFGYPVYIQNDASCAALGETIGGAAKGCSNAVMITLGTGVGSGIILNGRIFNGCDGMGAEIGHTKLVYNGLPCTCGQRGCFEAYASATALIKRAQNAAAAEPDGILSRLCGGHISRMNAKIPFDAAKQGDNTAADIIGSYIEYLACGLSSLVAVFRPEKIIIGGGISAEKERLIAPLKESLYRNTFAAEQIGIPEVVTAELGNDAGIIGAAMLCENQEVK